jgi:integrase
LGVFQPHSGMKLVRKMKSEDHVTTDLPTPNTTLGTRFVRVENANGRLRLRFTHNGRRYVVAVGLPDSKVNRLVAQQKAAQIELDIASGNFDVTLSKYKPPKTTSVKQEEVTVVQLFEH